jgi:hypothetical protein
VVDVVHLAPASAPSAQRSAEECLTAHNSSLS